MRCLVTGGAGFIGMHLTGALLAKGHDVRVLDDFSTGKVDNVRGLAAEVVHGDVRDRDAVRDAIDGVQYVFHLAALGSVARSVEDPLTTQAVNEVGTLTVLEASLRAKVRRLVFASSSSVYGNAPTLPKRETAKPAPASPYAVSKLAGEHYCRVFWETYGLETVCLRFFNVFGPAQDPDSQYAAVIPRFVRAALDGGTPTVYGDGKQSRDFTYVANTVDAVILAAFVPRAAGQVMNVACGERRSLLDLIAALEDIVGRRLAPGFESARAGDVKHSYAAIAKAEHLLGYRPRTAFVDGLRETVAWARRQTPVRRTPAGPRKEGRDPAAPAVH